MDNKKYTDFNNELNTMINYINSTPEKQSQLGIDEAQITQFKTYKNQYNTSFATYINPNERTHATIQEIKDTYTLVHKWIATLRQIIKTSKKDTLTSQDYDALFIHKDKTTRTRHTTISEVPTLEVKSQSGGIVNLGVFVAGTEIATKPKLPEFVSSVELKWCFSNDKTAPNEIKDFIEIFGNASPKITISKTDEGQYCHLVAYYLLPDGTKSQPSQVLSFVASTI